ncbi:MAG: hypothetical protein K1X67_22180 [Fimbriimonadaceae bacterium]|nr:hypothetical protein [Fimbriimonadaceae bacterium]
MTRCHVSVKEWILPALLVLMALSGPASAASFDCSQARTEAEHAVCSDDELSVLDEKMAALVRKLATESSNPAELRNSQIEWARSAEQCGGDVECLKASYVRRIQQLLPIESPSGSEQSTLPPLEAASDATATGQLPDIAPLEDAPIQESVRGAPATPNRTDTAAATSETINSGQSPSLFRTATAAGLFLGLIGVVLASILGTKAVADHTSRKYGWPLILNWWNALYIVGFFAIGFCAFLGPGGFQVGLMVAGVLWLVMLVVNISKTSLITGIVMTLIQPFVAALLWVLFGLARSKAGARRT